MLAPVDLNEVSTFVKVVEAGGFTAAAEELELPKSTISRRIARLEERLGVRLLERTTRTVATATTAASVESRRAQRRSSRIALVRPELCGPPGCAT